MFGRISGIYGNLSVAEQATKLEMKKTVFWEDNWHGIGTLLFPDVYTLNQHQKANINKAWSSQLWNLSFRGSLNDSEVDMFAGFYNTLAHFND